MLQPGEWSPAEIERQIGSARTAYYRAAAARPENDVATEAAWNEFEAATSHLHASVASVLAGTVQCGDEQLARIAKAWVASVRGL